MCWTDLVWHCFQSLLFSLRKYERESPHIVTIRNCCALASQAVHRVIDFPKGPLFSLKHSQEDALEHMFSGIKSAYRGTPTFKDLLVSTQLAHNRQRQQQKQKIDDGLEQWGGLDNGQVNHLAGVAYHAATTFFATTLPNTRPADLQVKFQNWFEASGKTQLFRGGPSSHQDKNEMEGEEGEKQEDEEELAEGNNSDSGSECAGSEVEGEGQIHEDPEDKEVADVLTHAEVHMAAAAEISNLQNAEKAENAVDHFESSRSDQHRQHARDCSEPPRQLGLRPEKTLAGILAGAGLLSYKPGAVDTEEHAVERGWKLAPKLVDFMVEARAW